MKKILCFLLIAMMLVFSTSCQKQENIASDDTTLGDTVADTTVSDTTAEDVTAKDTTLTPEWKNAYLNFLKTVDGEYDSFALVFVDGDNVPELYMSGSCEATGDCVCTYLDGEVTMQTLNRIGGGWYIAKSGNIINQNGNMGNVYTNVFKLDRNGFTPTFSAHLIERPVHLGNNEYKFTYEYSIEGRQVTEEEYNSAVQSAFDFEKAVRLDENAVDYDSICQQITDFENGDASEEAPANASEFYSAYLTQITDKNVISVKVPVFDDSALNTLVYDYIREHLTHITSKEFELTRTDDNITTASPNYSEYFIETEYKITYYSNDLISITFEGLLNHKTAAHPTHLFFTLNIDRHTKERIFFKDRFTVNEDLYKTFCDSAEIDITDKAEDLTEPFENFFDSICSFEKFRDGMTVENEFFAYYTEYGIGISYPVPFALGNHIEVGIPYSIIKDFGTKSKTLVEKNGLDATDGSVFETENITRIFLCIEYGNSEKIEVPAQYMQEITAWLDTFKVGEQIKEGENVPPGTNYCYVEIEYADGTVVNAGIDTVTVDGILYYTKHEKKPDCYYDILSRTSLN